MNKPNRHPSDLTDVEIESCIDGSSDVGVIRAILDDDDIITKDGLVDEDEFGSAFAFNIQGFISEPEDTPEWEEANQINLDWGKGIAENINGLICE